jgi:hypothetical protein
MHNQSYPPPRNCPNIICWRLEIRKLLSIQFSPTSYHFPNLGPKYSPQHPVLKHPQSRECHEMSHRTLFLITGFNLMGNLFSFNESSQNEVFSRKPSISWNGKSVYFADYKKAYACRKRHKLIKLTNSIFILQLSTVIQSETNSLRLCNPNACHKFLQNAATGLYTYAVQCRSLFHTPFFYKIHFNTAQSVWQFATLSSILQALPGALQSINQWKGSCVKGWLAAVVWP